MKTLPRDEADALWDKYWNEMREEWFKLEVLQDYLAEDDGPSLRSWLRGDKQTSIKLMKEELDQRDIKDYQQKQSQGVRLIRTRILKRPYTAYTEWELEYYQHVNTSIYGEQVYLVDKAAAGDLNLPSGDLMIFDKKRAAVNTYGHNGLMTHQTFYDESDDISQFLELAKNLKKLAKPLSNL